MLASWTKTDGARRRWSRGANVAAQVFLAFWLLVVVNGWAFQYSWRVDLTREQKWAIDDSTIEFLRSLPKSVDVVIPYRAKDVNAYTLLSYQVIERSKRLLDEFQTHAGPRLRVAEYVDVINDPAGWTRLRDQYEIDTPNLIYFFLAGETSKDRFVAIRPEDLAEFQLPSLARPEVVPKVVREHLAEGLSNALRRVVVAEQQRVLFSQGHGEPRLESEKGISIGTLHRDLVGRGYDVGAIDLLATPEVPADTALLVLLSVGADFSAYRGEARAAILEHVARGGSVLLFKPDQGNSGLEGALKDRGITLRDEWIVAEGEGRRPWQLLTTSINGAHPACSGLTMGEFRVAAQFAHRMEVVPPAMAVLSSPPNSWLERDLKYIRRDADEPFDSYPIIATVDNLYANSDRSLAPAAGADVAVEDTVPQGRWAVCGSWMLVLDPNNSALGWGSYQGGARQLILRTINWLTMRDLPVAGEGRVVKTTQLVVEDVARPLWWLALVFLPVTPLLAGIVVFLMRRG